uniref:Serine/threonine-protein phosphatase PGAM5, mitochondrial n=1 Tax=Hanusia phi TaxID=3032 RepID=A0A7S0HTS7_9CRYP|mmetsp:Transcript_33373/g.74823  ORF Transcript_33373/g.74823 Transcript_33373/m.74823 type:complete len:292 (+) Transcript_33373:51-926(+)
MLWNPFLRMIPGVMGRSFVQAQHITQTRKNAKRFLLGCTAAVIGAAGLQYNLKNLTAACEQKNSPKNEPELVDIQNLQKYNRNWDGRHPKEGEQKPKAIRYIILVRHGQYKDKETKDSNAVLTLKGRQQARILAQKILDTWKPTSLIVSDMTRAQQTMEILLEKLPKDIPLTTMKELREGRPCQPIPPSSSGLFQKSVVEADGARIDKAFNRIFYRAPVEQEHHSYEVVVCHANVIRYFVCKALQIPTEAWLRISLPHCSLTVIAIHPSGSVSLRTLGNTHYLPPTLITTS